MKEWVLTFPEGKKIVFQRDTGLCNRMPYIDMREHKEAFALLQTVQKNFEGFTQRQVKQAKLARRTQAMVCHPTDDKFKQMVSSKTLRNCHLKVKDVTNAQAIFGPYLPGLGGKMTRQKTKRVDPEYIGIPRDFYELQKFVTLTADVMFVNVIAFLTVNMYLVVRLSS